MLSASVGIQVTCLNKSHKAFGYLEIRTSTCQSDVKPGLLRDRMLMTLPGVRVAFGENACQTLQTRGVSVTRDEIFNYDCWRQERRSIPLDRACTWVILLEVLI